MTNKNAPHCGRVFAKAKYKKHTLKTRSKDSTYFCSVSSTSSAIFRRRSVVRIRSVDGEGKPRVSGEFIPEGSFNDNNERSTLGLLLPSSELGGVGEFCSESAEAPTSLAVAAVRLRLGGPSGTEVLALASVIVRL